MAGAAGVRPFASAAVMPQTETGTYLWCRKVVESQFDSCQQQSRRTGISAPYVRFFGEDMHGITVFASLPGNPDTPSMAVSACEKCDSPHLPGSDRKRRFHAGEDRR